MHVYERFSVALWMSLLLPPFPSRPQIPQPIPNYPSKKKKKKNNALLRQPQRLPHQPPRIQSIPHRRRRAPKAVEGSVERGILCGRGGLCAGFGCAGYVCFFVLFLNLDWFGRGGKVTDRGRSGFSAGFSRGV